MAPNDDGRGHILLEPYCILCRNHAQFARQTVAAPENPVNPELWEKVVLCFFSTASIATGGHREYIFRFKADGMRSRQEFIHEARPVSIDDGAIQATLEQSKMMLCHGCSDCDLEYTANVVHIPCFQLAKSRLPSLSIRQLCDVAWILRPVLAWYNAGQVLARQSRITQFPDATTLSSTELGSLIQNIRTKLPFDLERLICDEIPIGLFSSLSGCLNTLSNLEDNGWLEEGVHARKPLLSLMPFVDASFPGLIGSDTVNILGEVCLARITMNDDAQSSQEVIQLQDKPINGVQYALGTYGVLALRVCYTDGSVSAWLGNSPRKWIRFVRGSNLSTLEVQSDGHRILSLIFQVVKEAGKEAFTSDTEENVSSVFWEHAQTPDIDQEAVMIDIAPRQASVRGNPGARLVRNISFPVDDGQSHAITLFCSMGGTDCIQIDGDTNSRIGSPLWQSSPITFYTQPGEVVDAVYGLIRESGIADNFPCPAPRVLIRTTLDRWLYFGPFIVDPEKQLWHVVTQYGNEATHRATGLFFDALNSNIALSFYENCSTSMGVTQKPRRNDAVWPHNSWPLLHSPRSFPETNEQICCTLTGTFLNRAAVAGAHEIVQQRDGDRVRGLFARFKDDTIRVLGGWDPSKIRDDASATIFLADTDARLESITFVMSHLPHPNSEKEPFVQDIIINCGGEIDQPCFKWERLHEEVAWFFSHGEDYVGYWDGVELKPKMEPLEELRFKID